MNIIVLRGIDINCLVRKNGDVSRIETLRNTAREVASGRAELFYGDVNNVSSLVTASEGCSVMSITQLPKNWS